ncbi:cytochrome c oxidase assembly protein [Rhizocola hellebori]|uniref:Cytochrome c oxidase assembly protein n=1 Tax=Rhizocola hellebori TaxID=1392758 RepID=A0A8J3VDI9_9ACTN|nr:cytochrome d ubiquinol oxidase subunit II [Rhizocola hellebori]GIH03609.1 cytochrome c oxidase assembly protein [Rhizocola hellebori]
MTLADFWFIAITVLWMGFFILEGFDFGVGMLHGPVGKDEAGRRAAIATIGPLWDGNEVWLVVAGAAIFAAFPGWYATMFSGLYLAMVLLLVALILRGTSFEFRSKASSQRSRDTFSHLLTIASAVAPFLLGVALGDLLVGLPIGADQEFTGTFLDLLQPYALFVGITFVVLAAMHGATFLTLKTTGEVRERAARLARRIAPVAAVVVLIFAIWTHATAGKGFFPNVIEIAVVLAVLAAAWLIKENREGWAFTITTIAMASTVLAIFTDLYPRVMVSSTSAAYSLTVANTASGSYALKVMTVVLVVFLPAVLIYQSWTYHVFRQRISHHDLRGDD